MKFLPLVLANLGRHKRRTALTTLSVAAALFLFASLQTVVTTIAAAAQFGNVRRIVSMNATGIVFPLPLAYANRLRAVPGVEAVSWANWFGGRYGDNKRFFGQFAVDPASYLEMYPEMAVPEDQKQAFLREKSAAIIGRRLLDVFGWKLGQDITIQGTIFPGDWTFTIRGVYTPTDPAINDDMMIFRHDYLEERLGRPGIAGWYVARIDHPDNAARIGKVIDDGFRNSRAPTKTGTEQAFNASFATMWGNVSLLMGTIGLAVVFAILLVTANAMMMSARERIGEVAVLKTIGFTDRLLFTLVMTETALITFTGAAIGLVGAKLLYKGTNFNAAGFLPGFDVTPRTFVVGAAIAVLLALASGLMPALRAARLPIVSALRHVE
ncbi:MAG TPA: FtsX-like permease family protein [Gemmatimonadaceae bacterium]|nr:FtsX-like permease family protein [Gemmatimonadaceae bacterium]